MAHTSKTSRDTKTPTDLVTPPQTSSGDDPPVGGYRKGSNPPPDERGYAAVPDSDAAEKDALEKQ